MAWGRMIWPRYGRPRTGGFWEKAAAARDVGAALLVIDRPCRETGLSLEEMEEFLSRAWMEK